jgi:hypothetical protein
MGWGWSERSEGWEGEMEMEMKMWVERLLVERDLINRHPLALFHVS